MQLAANSYAIGPGFYDWEYDRKEREAEILDCRIDDLIDGLAEQNANHKSDRKYIENIIADAMEHIDMDQLNRWLWQIWVAHHCKEDTKKALGNFAQTCIAEMLGKGIHTVMTNIARK